MDDLLIQLHGLNMAVTFLEQGTSQRVADMHPGLDQDVHMAIAAYLDDMKRDLRQKRTALLEHLIFHQGYQLVSPTPGTPAISLKVEEAQESRKRPGPKPGFKKVPRPEPEPAVTPQREQAPEPPPGPLLSAPIVATPETIEQARKFAAGGKYHLVLDLYAKAVGEEKTALEQLLRSDGKRPVYSDAARKYILTSVIPEPADMEYARL